MRIDFDCTDEAAFDKLVTAYLRDVLKPALEAVAPEGHPEFTVETAGSRGDYLRAPLTDRANGPCVVYQIKLNLAHMGSRRDTRDERVRLCYCDTRVHPRSLKRIVADYQAMVREAARAHSDTERLRDGGRDLKALLRPVAEACGYTVKVGIRTTHARFQPDAFTARLYAPGQDDGSEPAVEVIVVRDKDDLRVTNVAFGRGRGPVDAATFLRAILSALPA